MAGQQPILKGVYARLRGLWTGVNALMSGHPRLVFGWRRKEDVDARNKCGHDER
jgi:hypothetical protein